MEKDYSVAKKILQQLRSGSFASQQLETGNIYTRDDLRNLFHINASSINNGIFKPAAFDSVWIFVTEHKTADRTQYEDVLIDDVLHIVLPKEKIRASRRRLHLRGTVFLSRS